MVSSTKSGQGEHESRLRLRMPFFCKIISDSRPSSSRLRILSSQFITTLALVNILITSRLNVFAFYLFVVSVTMNLFKKSAYIKMSSSSFHQLQQR